MEDDYLPKVGNAAEKNGRNNSRQIKEIVTPMKTKSGLNVLLAERRQMMLLAQKIKRVQQEEYSQGGNADEERYGQ